MAGLKGQLHGWLQSSLGCQAEGVGAWVPTVKVAPAGALVVVWLSRGATRPRGWARAAAASVWRAMRAGRDRGGRGDDPRRPRKTAPRRRCCRGAEAARPGQRLRRRARRPATLERATSSG